MINKAFSICRNAKSEIIAIIENTAISEMTAHSDGIYIYSKRYYREYDDWGILSCRAFCIKADWTHTRHFSYKSAKRVAKIQGVPLILCDSHIYDEMPDCVFIGFEG